MSKNRMFVALVLVGGIVFITYNLLIIESSFSHIIYSTKLKGAAPDILNYLSRNVKQGLSSTAEVTIKTLPIKTKLNITSKSSIRNDTTTVAQKPKIAKVRNSNTTHSDPAVTKNASTTIFKPKQTTPKSTITTTKKPVAKPVHPACTDPFAEDFRSNPGRYICNDVGGGVGNHMFAYAAAYGIATSKNMTVVTKKSRSLNNFFNLSAKLVDSDCFCGEVTYRHCHPDCAFDPNLAKFTADKNYKIGGYLQSWKFFSNVEDDLRIQFTFRDDVRRKANEILSKARNQYIEAYVKTGKKVDIKNVTFVGIHVRRGDILDGENFRKYGYNVAPKEYIKKAMDFFMSNFSNVVFLLCSDRMAWVKKNIKQKNVFYVEGNPFIHDMGLLAACNHTIMTVGTFGWWSAFLAGGVTVYYKYPAREGSGLRKQFSKDYSDFFHPKWIGME